MKRRTASGIITVKDLKDAGRRYARKWTEVNLTESEKTKLVESSSLIHEVDLAEYRVSPKELGFPN